MLILGVQHMFAMFGATVLVPLLTGLDVSVTLLFAGIGTLIFHFISKWNVPAFLGLSPDQLADGHHSHRHRYRVVDMGQGHHKDYNARYSPCLKMATRR